MKVLVVVDMQNDFIDGTLGTPEAQAIVPKVIEKIEEFDGKFCGHKTPILMITSKRKKEDCCR